MHELAGDAEADAAGSWTTLWTTDHTVDRPLNAGALESCVPWLSDTSSHGDWPHALIEAWFGPLFARVPIASMGSVPTVLGPGPPPARPPPPLISHPLSPSQVSLGSFPGPVPPLPPLFSYATKQK